MLHAHTLYIRYVCKLWADRTARGLQARCRPARLPYQMFYPRDYLAVRPGPAFGIAPCGKLWSKEFCGVALCVSCVCQHLVYKMAFDALKLPRNSLHAALG